MKAIERIYQYLDFKGIKIVAFEKKCSISNGYIGKMYTRKSDIGETIMLQILENCPDISPEWLLTGKGSMLKDVPPTKEMSPEEYFIKPVPSAAPEPAPSPNDGSIPYIMRRYEELIAENALLKKENEDLKLSRGKAFDDDIYTKFSTKINSDNPVKPQ